MFGGREVVGRGLDVLARLPRVVPQQGIARRQRRVRGASDIGGGRSPIAPHIVPALVVVVQRPGEGARPTAPAVRFGDGEGLQVPLGTQFYFFLINLI